MGTRTWTINRHALHQTSGQMRAGHGTKLGCAVQGSTGGSTHEGGTLVLLQAGNGGPHVLAAEALVPCMLTWLTGATATLAHLQVCRPAD